MKASLKGSLKGNQIGKRPPTLHLHTSNLGLFSFETTSYTPHLPPLSRSVSLLSTVTLSCSLFQSAHGCGDQQCHRG